MLSWLSDNGMALIQIGLYGLTSGMIIALIALGYTMVYGIVELINFAHGDLFMLGCFSALTVLGGSGLVAASGISAWAAIALMLVGAAVFCAGFNWAADRLVYRPIRHAPKLTVLVSAIGVSFVFVNLGLFWGALPMAVFGGGTSAASPKDFPDLLGNANLLGDRELQLRSKDVLVFAVTLPLLALLTWLVKGTGLGRAMRATAQNPTAARLMGIDVDRTIGRTFIIAGALAGVASVISALSTSTISFQMGFRGGMDAFTAAVLGGIGSLPGAVLGALLIGLVRAYTQFLLSDAWASVAVFMTLILLLIFRPSGLLGSPLREKV